MEDTIITWFSNWFEVTFYDAIFFVLYKIAHLDFLADLRYTFSSHTEETKPNDRHPKFEQLVSLVEQTTQLAIEIYNDEASNTGHPQFSFENDWGVPDVLESIDMLVEETMGEERFL